MNRREMTEEVFRSSLKGAYRLMKTQLELAAAEGHGVQVS
jgi:hypothetical protein